jgi:hypothetical protein
VGRRGVPVADVSEAGSSRRLGHGRAGRPTRLLFGSPVALLWRTRSLGRSHHCSKDRERGSCGGDQRTLGLGRRLEPRAVRQGVGRLGRGQALASFGYRTIGTQCAYALSPHQIDDLLSIDHIAVPSSWQVTETRRYRAFVEQNRISDHDAYTAEVSYEGRGHLTPPSPSAA